MCMGRRNELDRTNVERALYKESADKILRIQESATANGWSSERHTSLLDNGRVVTDEDNVNGFTSFAEA